MRLSSISIRFAIILVMTSTVSSVIYGETINGSPGQISGSDWQSGYMDLDPPRDFKKGDKLMIKVEGNAEWVRVRLLPQDANPGQPTGLLNGKMRVPAGGVLEVVLKKKYSKIKQISVHAGKKAWGESLNPNGGEIGIASIDVVSN